MSDGADEAGHHQEGNEDLEQGEAAHQERVEDGHQGPDALRIEAVDAGLSRISKSWHER